MDINIRTAALFGVGLACAATLPAADWPAWRGPDGTGVATGAEPPLQWSTNENVRWRVSLPDRGNSSPIVSGDRVFVSQSIQKENRRALLCFDRATGKLRWQAGVTYAEAEPTQENNPYCSGSPATDGKRVYVCFNSAGVYAFDLDGKEIWRRDLGKISHMFGSAVSPVLYGNLCILNYGPGENARLVALDKMTGKTVWEVEPPKLDPAEMPAMGGMGRPGGPGGRGGFGPGMFLAPQILSQADKQGDGKLTKAEFTALSEVWFDKLDPGKTGKLSQQQFTDGIAELLPPPPGAGPPGGGPPGGGRGFGPGRFIGPALFAAADLDKDGSLTRTEFKATFEKWFADWDADKSGLLTETSIRDGLNAALPRPTFGGPGGPGGPGGGRGPGGMGGPGGRGGFAGTPTGSWSTPVLIKTDRHEELVVSFAGRLNSFDPATGKPRWVSKGLGAVIYSSPLWGDGVLVATSSDMGGGSAIALRPGGQGDVTENQRLWRQDRVKGAIGSGVIHNGYLYTISSDGIAGCRDLKTGDKVWEERLAGPGPRTSSWSSLLLAGDRIYAPNQSGDVFVLRAGPKFELLATNSVLEPTNASLAASNGELFIRTDHSLWCIGKKS